MLSPRLQSVADLIHGPRHADIGSDHGLLPLYLCRRLEFVIAVEKHPGPLERLRQSLMGSPVEVRSGDGLGPVAQGEVDSLSICGMGALNIRAILEAHPERLPRQLILQPMDGPQPVRDWALQRGWHLVQELWVEPHVILEYQPGLGADPAYQGLPVEMALHYGPLLLKNLSAAYRQELNRQVDRLQTFDQPHFQPSLEYLRGLLA